LVQEPTLRTFRAQSLNFWTCPGPPGGCVRRIGGTRRRKRRRFRPEFVFHHKRVAVDENVAQERQHDSVGPIFAHELNWNKSGLVEKPRRAAASGDKTRGGCVIRFNQGTECSFEPRDRKSQAAFHVPSGRSIKNESPGQDFDPGSEFIRKRS